MKKKYLLATIIISLIAFETFAQSFRVDGNMSPQELVEDFLFENSNCIDNGTTPPSSLLNGSTANINSIGMFTSGTSDFPLEAGLILSTGSINAAQNNPGGFGEGDDNGWDDNNQGNNDDFGYPITNPTELSFLFTPRTNNTRFNYIFASDEYSNSNGASGCSNRDGFLFLIRKSGTSDSFTNIATLPGNAPINVNNIRPSFSDSNNIELCPSENETLLADVRSGETNRFPEYARRTIPLQTANNAFEVGQEYEVRILIGDDSDFSRDSAVFIEQFNDNLQPINITANASGGSSVQSNNSDRIETFSTCSSSLTLNVDDTNFPTGTTLQWFRSNSAIPGGNLNSLNINQQEDNTLYRLDVSLNGSTSCTISEEFLITLSSNINLADTTFQICVPSGNPLTSTITLSDINNNIATTQAISYHPTLNDAENNSNQLTGTFNAANNDTIFARYTEQGCDFITPVNISIATGFNLSTITDCPYYVVDRANEDGFEGYQLFDNSTAFCSIDNEPIQSVTNYFFENLPPNTDATLSYFRINDDGTRGNEIATSSFASESISIRAVLTDVNTGCESEVDVNIEITIPEGELPNTPLRNIEACDDGVLPGTDSAPDNLDGFASFDLTDNFNRLVNTGNNISRRVSFHASAQLANCNTGNIDDDTIIALWNPNDSSLNIDPPTNYVNDPNFTTNNIQNIGFRIENQVVCNTDGSIISRPAILGSFQLRPRYIITNIEQNTTNNPFFRGFSLSICDNLGTNPIGDNTIPSIMDFSDDNIGVFDFQNIINPNQCESPSTITIEEYLLGETNELQYTIELYTTRDGAINQDQSRLINTSSPFTNRNPDDPEMPAEEIFVRILDQNPTRTVNTITEPNENFGCFDIEPINLIVEPAIELTLPTDVLQICDVEDDNENDSIFKNSTDGIISATDLITEITNNTLFIDEFNSNVNVSLSYFLTEDKARATCPLDSIVTLENDPDFESSFRQDEDNLVFIKASSNSGQCSVIQSITYRINRAPLLNDISNNPLIVCYDENTITTNPPTFEIDITQNQLLLFTDPEFTATYFVSEADARNNVNALTTEQTTNFDILDPIFNGLTSVWYRVENEITECVSFAEQRLIINEQPDLRIGLQEVVECIDPNTTSDLDNRFSDFDLSLQSNSLLNLQSDNNPNGNIQTGLVIKYYEDRVEAEQQGIEIADPSAYRNTTANQQIIFYRLENAANPSCASEIGELTLRVELETEFNTVPNRIPQCDEDNISGTGSKFNLTEIAELFNTQNESFDITFHISDNDAINNINPLGEPDFDESNNPILSYITSSFDEQIFPRVVSSVGCVERPNPIELNTLFKPALASDNISISVCDINLPAGSETFDLLSLLTINSPQIVFADPRVNNNQIIRDNVNILFFQDNEVEQNVPKNQARFVNRIPDNGTAGTNTTSNYVVNNTTEVIFIELVNDQGCFFQASVTLTVDPIPDFNIPVNPITICEDSFGSNQFDNTLVALENIFQVPEVIAQETIDNTNDISFLEFTYFFRNSNEQQPDLDNLITDANDDDITASEIFVVLTNTRTLCTSSKIVSIAPKTLPAITTPLNTIICDEDGNPNDGATMYDLSLFNDQILNPEGTAPANERSFTDFNIAYFNADGTELTGAVSIVDDEIITATLTDNRTPPNCENSVNFTIRLEPQPIAAAPNPALLSICDIDTNQDGTVAFNFGADPNIPSELKDSILAGQPATNFTVTYYNNITDARNDINNLTPIPTEATSQQYVAKVTNNTTACFNTVTFSFTVSLLPQFTSPASPIQVCENTFGTGRFDVDLSSLIGTDPSTQIVVDSSLTNFTSAFYTQDNGATEPVPANLVTNGLLLDTSDLNLFVEITNTDTSCSSFKAFSIEHKQLPSITAPAPLSRIICDDDSDGEIISDLSRFDVEILNGRTAANFTIRYFDTVIPIRNEITVTSTLVDGTTYTAEITDNRDSLLCSNSVDFVLTITRQANTTNPAPIEVCSVDNTTVIDFDDLSSTILQNEGNPNNFDVTFHNTEIEANNSNVNTISNPLSSNNYVAKITNNTNPNGCPPKIVPFEVVVNRQPEINTSATQEYCRDENLNTEIGGITRRERLNSLLVADRTNVVITYHLSEQDAFDNIETDMLQNTLFVKAIKTFNSGESNEIMCETIASINLTEIPLPTIPNLTLSACDEDEVNDGNFAFDFSSLNTTILDSQEPTTSDFDISYHFSKEDAESSITIPFGELITTGTYYVKVQQVSARCTTIAPINITINTLPNIELEDIVFCRNDPDRLINAGNFDPSFTYLWEFKDDFGNTIRANETTNSINLSVNDINTNITLTITDPDTLNNCNNSTTIRVSESTSPVITPIILKNFDANEVTINVEEEGDFLYGFNDSNISNAQESNTFIDLLPGMFTLYVFDVNGCDPASVDVIFVDYFPAFTPNGNGPLETELWHIQGVETIPETLVYIYNRYGKLLKTLTSRSAGWDGTYNGTPLPSDDYWILIRLPDGQEIKDHITLKR